jgi:plasmid stabilization system protein ParE
MRLEILPQADADLEDIIAYYHAVAPEALPRILADIDRSLDRICEFPKAYSRQPGKSYRRLVTRKYRFKIVYQVFADRVEVIGIFRFQNRLS